METQTVLAVLQALDQRTGTRHMYGVYPINKLPKKIKKPAALVINTSEASQETGHWLGLYIPTKGATQYFDSYGTIPLQPEIFVWLRTIRCHKKLLFNKKRYQSDESDVCGCYVLTFLAKRMKFDIPKLPVFTKNYEKNDVAIKNIFETILKMLQL
jgi:hypothetical protein